MTAQPPQEPGIAGFSLADLHRPERLRDLYDAFCAEVEGKDPQFWREWDQYRRAPDTPRDPVVTSSLLVRMAPFVSNFVGRLFNVQREQDAHRQAIRVEDELFRFKSRFVRHLAQPLADAGESVTLSPADAAIVETLIGGSPAEDLEHAVARAGCRLLERQAALGPASASAEREQLAREIDALKRWCARRLRDPAYRSWTVFRLPGPVDFDHLVEFERPDPALPQAMIGPQNSLRRRDGFTLTDARMNEQASLNEIHYCLLCHERDKDSCAKGFHDKTGAVLSNPLGIPLTGCPLDEKISEMILLARQGDPVGAQALVAIDNPLSPGTGHRICNDCMKGCIFQKQDAVNVPQIETRVLTDVLALPWGVEIFGLLARWNPLNVRRPYGLPYNGKNVLVVGLGPAGYMLAHLLVNEGFGVVGIDALKIEPFPEELTGSDQRAPRPIHDWSEIYQPLDMRVLDGFGGVAEYGITVRWDKNFLNLLHLTMARRRHFRMYDGVRFGGAIRIEDAWAYGFDHIAIAAGAGRPTVVDMKNNLIRGVREASDFLMALQLGGAFQRDSLANLQARLPALIIGGGLTAIDGVTEVLAYYAVLAEKTLKRYETLAVSIGEARVRAVYSAEELEGIDELLTHGRALRAERERAAQAGEKPDFVPLLRSWGGASIVYRRGLTESPAYRQNHEEVVEAFREGMTFIEHLSPEEAIPDRCGAVAAVRFRRTDTDGTVELPARTVLVAAGTMPNITYEEEYPGTFQMDARKRFFQPHEAELSADGAVVGLRPAGSGMFTSHNSNGRLISFYGDNHPAYAGTVVRAMASARDGYPQVTRLFARELAALDPAAQADRDRQWASMAARLDEELVARVERVVRITPSVVEIIARAPAAARHFRPGQFYRQQNYERLAVSVDHSRLVMEGIALTGAWMDPAEGRLSLIALELGVSSRLCAYLRPGERLVLMGPTGNATEIPARQVVLLAGGGLGNAVLFSIARALREARSTVVYFAAYKKGEDLFKREDIEAGTDQIVWSTDGGAPIRPHRPQDAHVRGNIVEAMLAYARGEIGHPIVRLDQVDRIIAIGSDRMMAAVSAARHTLLKPYLRPGHVGIASINSPMQCMMKKVCAQCLQRHVDPITGKESIIFSCSQQDQDMDHVDFVSLHERLRQTTEQEKLSNLWLDHILPSLTAPHV